ncbi:hypothetical protein Tco_0893591 [Tanacetum coccineum]|uniref:Uncharacterized protein n=1 Tax=Tanacetum coccineum TaxID=301880 RepID=A0ABQ5CEN3_9ASTR
MSDSDESGITYTEVSNPFEGLSDIGGTEEDDDEDPEEDPVDYHADGGDDGDDEEGSSEDDEDVEHGHCCFTATDQLATFAKKTEPFELMSCGPLHHHTLLIVCDSEDFYSAPVTNTRLKAWSLTVGEKLWEGEGGGEWFVHGGIGLQGKRVEVNPFESDAAIYFPILYHYHTLSYSHPTRPDAPSLGYTTFFPYQFLLHHTCANLPSVVKGGRARGFLTTSGKGDLGVIRMREVGYGITDAWDEMDEIDGEELDCPERLGGDRCIRVVLARRDGYVAAHYQTRVEIQYWTGDHLCKAWVQTTGIGLRCITRTFPALTGQVTATTGTVWTNWRSSQHELPEEALVQL